MGIAFRIILFTLFFLPLKLYGQEECKIFEVIFKEIRSTTYRSPENYFIIDTTFTFYKSGVVTWFCDIVGCDKIQEIKVDDIGQGNAMKLSACGFMDSIKFYPIATDYNDAVFKDIDSIYGSKFENLDRNKPSAVIKFYNVNYYKNYAFAIIRYKNHILQESAWGVILRKKRLGNSWNIITIRRIQL